MLIMPVGPRHTVISRFDIDYIENADVVESNVPIKTRLHLILNPPLSSNLIHTETLAVAYVVLVLWSLIYKKYIMLSDNSLLLQSPTQCSMQSDSSSNCKSHVSH